MDRRRFLQLLTSGAAAAAVAPVIPFGRVWSFPTKIVLPFSSQNLALPADFELYDVTIETGPSYEIGDILMLDGDAIPFVLTEIAGSNLILKRFDRRAIGIIDFKFPGLRALEYPRPARTDVLFAPDLGL